MLKLERYERTKDSKIIRESPIIVVIGDSLKDFCLYYNLCSLRYDVLWAPNSIIESSYTEVKRVRETQKKSDSELITFNSLLITKLNSIINESYRDRKIVFTSFSNSENEIKKYFRYII